MTTDSPFNWRQAQDPLVRELGWNLFSTPVVEALPGIAPPWPVQEDRGAVEILAALDRDPDTLQQHLAALGDKRLGARFEAAWSYFFTHHPRYELLAQNWPVHQRGRTLGALDFLFRDTHLGTVIHAEMAIKFYLYKAGHTGPELARWIGPNPDDSLHLKLQHLASHQLALSDRSETRQQLTQAALPVPDRKAVLVKGWLFHPLGQLIDTPAPVNADHPRGEWLTQCELPALLADQSHHPFRTQWSFVSRHQWLMPVRNNRDHATLRRQVSAHLTATGQPAMICRFVEGGEPMAAQRYFVVPDHWPDSR